MNDEEVYKELMRLFDSVVRAAEGIRKRRWRDSEKAMAIASAHRQKKALLYVMDKLVFDSKPLSRGEATPEDNAALRNVIKASSAECPFCHWGFDPAVLTQHVREKHANEAQ